MLQKVIAHPASRFTRCSRCGHEPHHIRSRGRTSKEPVQFILTGVRHSLECPCGTRTALHESLAHAEAQWGSDYAQRALVFQAPRRRRVSA